MKKTFVMTEDHIKLISNMWVGWQHIETGAPEIDPKYPYGDRYVALSIHEMLTGEQVDEVGDELEEQYMNLHRETEIALQIILHTRSFEAGTYVLKEYGKEWQKV